MTKPKRLAPEYEDEVQRAIFDIDSLVSAAHLLPRATLRAAMRDVIRGAINRSVGKAEVNIVEKARTVIPVLQELDLTKERIDNSSE